MADRYTYLPLIGILAGFTWGSEELSRVKPFAQSLVTTGWAIITVTLAFITFTQTGYWRDTRSLYEHTLKVTSGNYVALTARVTGTAAATSTLRVCRQANGSFAKVWT